MHNLVMLLTHIVLGRSVSASNRLTHKVWWRIPIYLILIGSAAWVALASALLWTSGAHPGVVGLIAFVERGGPVWLLGIPLVALLTALVASLPAAGRYGPACMLQAATFALTLAGMATFQGDGHAALNLAAVSSFLVTLPATLLAVVTALADQPPVDSPLAYTTASYFGRVGHLRTLVVTARRLGWEVEGPTGSERVLTTGGYYGGGRAARVVSGATISQYGPNGDAPGYWYTVTMSSPKPLPGFRIARAPIPPEYVGRAVTGVVNRSLTFYVIPPSDQRVSDGWTQRFARQIAEGAGYLPGKRDNVQIVSGGVLYTRFSPLRLPAQSGQFEPQVEWLIGIASLLEELVPQASQDVTASDDWFAAKLPYGQLSPVDPTRRSW